MATESCDYQLAADLAANCTVKPVKGIKSHGYIMNYDDIDFEATTRDPTNPNIVKALILKTGAKAYKNVCTRQEPLHWHEKVNGSRNISKPIQQGRFRRHSRQWPRCISQYHRPACQRHIRGGT